MKLNFMCEYINRRMKLRGALLLVVAATVCMLSGLISPQEAAASVDAVNQWPAKPTIASNSAATPVTAVYTPGTGTNRLMLVAVASEYSGAGTPVITVTYGGVAQTATQIVANTTQNSKIWLGYFTEAQIAAGSAGTKVLSVTNSVSASLTAMYASVAVYNGVNQTTPITGSGSNATASAASLLLSIPLAANAGLAGNAGLSVYVANWNGQTSTPAAGYAEVSDYAGTNFNLAYCYKVITGTTTEAPTTTAAVAAAGAAAGVSLNPALRLATIAVGACGDCHGNPPQDGPGTARNTPPGQFIGSHGKHAGKNEGQYGQLCTQCHRNNATISHANGFKNVSGSNVPRSVGGYTQNNQPINNTVTFGTCSNISCHSSGRTVSQRAVTPAWNATTTCLSCHGGRSTAGQNPPARSTGNFSMSTSHSQHLKYLTTEMNCQTCHGKIAANHTALKDYTGAIYHGNGSKNVVFTNIAYGSYTSYKSPASGSIGTTKTCNNTSCHGGQSRNGWRENLADGGINNTHTCTHCHGQLQSANILPSNTNRNNFAPGYLNTGTSTDQISVNTDRRVGAHYVHLSSVYMKKLKCNECHRVPTTAFDGTHMTGLRYNSQSITFGQASTATKNSVFTSFTSGTAVKAATCSTTYCHGSKMPLSDTSGTYKKPSWNLDLTNNTPSTTVCGRCHGAPPTAGTSAGTHSGATLTGANACSTCHGSVVNSTGVVINKLLHINGIVEAAGGDCTSVSCHGAASLASPIAGGLGGPATRRNVVAEHKNTWSHKRSSGGGVPANVIVTKDDCIVCHMEGDKATGGTTGFHKDGYIDLRDPDSGLHIKNVTWNNATPGAYVEGLTDLRFVQFSRNLAARLELDTNWLVIAAIQQNLCLKCHDTNGANHANARVTTGGTAMRPFGVAITNHAAPLGSNGSGNVVDVNKSFLTSNATYHPVTGKQNNGFADSNLLTAPWNVKAGTGNAAVYGPLMSCWDCHAPAGASGAQTRTVTAHGGPATLRSPIWAGGTTAAANLCLVCHLASAYPSGNGNHGATSAFTGGANNMGGDMPTCHICHSTYTNARPVRAEDVHGFNDKTPNSAGSKWASGSRPYSFFRTSQLGDWAPASATGDTLARNSTCNSGACSNNNMNGSNGIVGTGGTY